MSLILILMVLVSRLAHQGSTLKSIEEFDARH